MFDIGAAIEAAKQTGLLDLRGNRLTSFPTEIVKLTNLRSYLKAFAGAAYQNPKSICPRHHMILPRIIKG